MWRAGERRVDMRRTGQRRVDKREEMRRSAIEGEVIGET